MRLTYVAVDVGTGVLVLEECACVRCVCVRVASIGDKVRMSGKWRFCSSVKRQGNTSLSVPSSHYLAPSQQIV